MIDMVFLKTAKHALLMILKFAVPLQMKESDLLEALRQIDPPLKHGQTLADVSISTSIARTSIDTLLVG